MGKWGKWALWRIAWRQIRKLKRSDLKEYVQYYNEHNLKDLLKHSATHLSGAILMPVLRAFYTLKSPKTPAKEKLYIIGALGYFILPTDLFPDFFGMIGYADDIAVLTFILRHVSDNLTDEIEDQATQTYNRLLRQKADKHKDIKSVNLPPRSGGIEER